LPFFIFFATLFKVSLIDEKKTEEMIKSGVHFGYSSTSLNPKMKPFIFTSRNNTEIFDLEKIYPLINSAKEFLKELAKNKKEILLVGTKKEAQKSIEELAKELNAPYVVSRWLGGTLTNFNEIKKRIDYLNGLYQKKQSGELEKYTKKERLEIGREISRMEKYLEGIKKCQSLPAALVLVDSRHEKTAVAEAKKMKIPVVAVMNSDCNPEDADYPIPANDNSITSISFIVKELGEAYKEGLKQT